MSTNATIVWIVGLWFVFIMVLLGIDTRKTEPAPNPDAARVRTLEAKVSRLKDELEFREFQTSSTILKGE